MRLRPWAREHYRTAYVWRCGAAAAAQFFRGPVTPSSGMFAIVIALSLCNHTSVFGFGTGARGGYQYYGGRRVAVRARLTNWWHRPGNSCTVCYMTE